MIAFRVRVLDETTSTNTEIKRAIDAGEPEGLAVRALRQTGGYGRQGRTWVSPHGGLYLSLLLRPRVEAALLPTLSLVVSLAARQAFAKLIPSDTVSTVRIKWPNDVVIARPVGGCLRSVDACNTTLAFPKLCGISLEAHAGATCIGIGVNVRVPAEEFNVDGKNSPAYLEQLSPGLAALPLETVLTQTLATLLKQVSRYYETWQRDGFTPFLDEYNISNVLNGKKVHMVDRDNTSLATGTVLHVDENGRLVLCDDGGTEFSVSSGEAHLV